MLIDLHTHSNRSDGTDTPAQVVQAAHERGIGVLGLTDHDTVAGWAEAAAEVARLGSMQLVRGTEFTTHFHTDPSRRDHGGHGVSVHMLGYLFNPEHPLVAAHFARMGASREERAREIVDRLAVDFDISWERVLEFREPGAPVGRPHIADTLVAMGIIPNRSAAFTSILASHGKYYVPTPSPDSREVVEWIVAAGGKAVVAHPKGIKRGNYLPDSAFEELREVGLFGTEIDHRDNPMEERPALAALAKRLGLVAFGSSDYHGTGKPNRIGENTTSEESYQELIRGTYLEVIPA